MPAIKQTPLERGGFSAKNQPGSNSSLPTPPKTFGAQPGAGPALPPITPRLKIFAAGAEQVHKTGYSPGAVGMTFPTPSLPTASPGSPVSSLQKKATMLDPFMSGFVDELVKTAAIGPMAAKVKAGATMLGKSVKNIAAKAAKRVRMKGVVIRGKKGIGKKAALRKIAEGDMSDESAQDMLSAIMEEAQARFNNDENEQGYNEQMGGGADDISYGAGRGIGHPMKNVGSGPSQSSTRTNAAARRAAPVSPEPTALERAGFNASNRAGSNKPSPTAPAPSTPRSFSDQAGARPSSPPRALGGSNPQIGMDHDD